MSSPQLLLDLYLTDYVLVNLFDVNESDKVRFEKEVQKVRDSHTCKEKVISKKNDLELGDVLILKIGQFIIYSDEWSLMLFHTNHSSLKFLKIESNADTGIIGLPSR